MKVLNVLVITGIGDDIVEVHTDLPMGVSPFIGNVERLVIPVSKGSGVRYALENFSCGVTEFDSFNKETIVRRKEKGEKINGR